MTDRSVEGAGEHPSWEGELRWPASVAIAAAIALQLKLPGRLTISPRWLLPGLEALILVALVIVSPTRITRTSAAIRSASLGLIAVATVGNVWSAVHLVDEIFSRRAGDTAPSLLATGGAIWLTNVIIFALWYWELDGGGPAVRAAPGPAKFPAFLFPQMGLSDNPGLVPPHWRPELVDYLYTSFTNATAFSPTDVMPLARWAKLMMLVQSAVSLMTVGLVIARAVNILK